MSRPYTLAALAAAAFLAAIVAANYATTRHGFVPVGLGLEATAGTYLAGACFVLRDAVHDLAGRAASLAAIAAGGAMSFAVADPFIALASAVAFTVSETVDLAVYSPLRSRGYIRAAAASNLAGSVVDTLLFLSIAGLFAWAAVPGQLVGKAWITIAVIATVGVGRALLRNPVRAEGA